MGTDAAAAGAEGIDRIGETLIDSERLHRRVAELGAEIDADYAGRDLVMVGVLKGALIFMADLMRALTVPCEIDLMAVSQLRLLDRLLRGGPDPQGPRHLDRRAATC